MKLGRNFFALAVALVLPAVFSGRAFAQGLDANALLKPTPDSWPIYHGDYSGQRHSRLTQITPANVGGLTLAWAFQTGQATQIKSSPIVANGILYVSIPDHLWAVDARTGAQIWHYTYPANEGLHIGHRGVAVYKDSVYLTTPDDHLVCLDARDGTVRWNVVLADVKQGYWTSVAPLIVRDHVLVGVSGDFDNIPGMLKSLSADTGRVRWRKRVGGLAASAPGAAGASVYFVANRGGYGGIAGAGPAKVVAMNRRTGRVRWAKRLGYSLVLDHESGLKRAIPAGSRLYVGSGEQQLEGYVGCDSRPLENVQLVCRAWDTAAQTQPEEPAHVWNFKGYMNNAWHRVRVTCA